MAKVPKKPMLSINLVTKSSLDIGSLRPKTLTIKPKIPSP